MKKIRGITIGIQALGFLITEFIFFDSETLFEKLRALWDEVGTSLVCRTKNFSDGFMD